MSPKIVYKIVKDSQGSDRIIEVSEGDDYCVHGIPLETDCLECKEETADEEE